MRANVIKLLLIKKRANCPSAHALIAQIVFLKSVLVMKMQETGVNLSMLSRQLIGTKFRLIHRYLFDLAEMIKIGLSDTLQDTITDMCVLG